MNSSVIPPVPKPRTRLNVVQSVKPEPSEVVLNKNESSNCSTVTPTSQYVLQNSISTSLYPFKEAGLEEYKPNALELDVGEVNQPERPAPPPPIPPPPGWNLDTNVVRVAPPPPGLAPKLPRKDSSISPNSIISCTPSPPLTIASCPRDSPIPPMRSPRTPNEDDSSTATYVNTCNLENDSTRVIENPGYMSLEQFRTLASSSTATSGFCSLGSPASPRRVLESVGSTSGSCSPIFQEIVKDLPLDDDPPSNILDMKLPSVDATAPTIDNSYTPLPKMSDFVRNSTASCSELLKEDEKRISLSDGHEIEIAGTAVCFFGFVSIHVGKKERKRAHARLKNMNLSFHEDDETNDLLSGPFQLAGCQMIAQEEDTVFIRLNEMETQKSITFTVDGDAETWGLLLGECWISDYSILKGSVKNITFCGQIWLRHGSAAEWQVALCCYSGKSFHYVIRDSPEYIYELDLRKVLVVREKVDKSQWCPQLKKKSRGAFMMTMDGCSLYMECEDDVCTTKWHDALNKAVNAIPSNLEEYRLTADNVPMIVDKCIRFISLYGMSSEGIYRRNGKISEAKDIMSKLLDDPSGTHLLPSTDETVYAVADVLRQFFRKLPTSLFPPDIHAPLFRSLQLPQVDLLEELRKIIQTLPTVHFSTLRKLMSHLKEVSNNCEGNKASFDNLAKVFGPSLFHTDSESEMCFKDNSKQISIIAILIVDFEKVFELTMREELSRELLNAKKAEPPHNKRQAKGLLVPIHIWEKENLPFNVKTDLAAEEACREAIAKRGFNGPVDGKYAIFEVLRDSNLRRKLHPGEKLSEIVVNRWIPWNCGEGYLLFNHDDSLDEDDISSFSGKVKISEPGTKTFKSCELKIERGEKVIATKGDKVWKEWDVHGLVWYIGSEPSRKAPYPSCTTFFVVNATNCRDKLVGFCVSFKQIVDRTKFLNTINFIQTGGQPAPLVYI